jgi:hypothetical protein
LEVARSIEPSDIEYLAGSVLQLDEVRLFDVVTGFGVLTVACRNEEQLRATLRRIHRALVPGGLYFGIEPIHRGFLHRVLDFDFAAFLAVMREEGFEIRDTAELHFWPARLVLCQIKWPRSLTFLGYWAGQALLRLSPRALGLGDYKAFVGMKPQ